MRQIVLILLLSISSIVSAQNNKLSDELSCVDLMMNDGKQELVLSRLYHMRDSINAIPNFNVADYFGVVNSLVAYLPTSGQLAELDNVINEAMTICKERENAESFLPYLYAAKSQMYGELLDFNLSLNCALEGLKVCEKVNRKDLVYIMLLGNAANAYSANEDYLSSKLYADEAIAEIESDDQHLQDKDFINIYGFLLNNSAVNYYRMGRLADAEHSFRRVLEIEDIKNRPDSPHLFAFNNLAVILLFQHKYEEALKILEKIPETNYRTSLSKADNSLTAHVMLHDLEVVNSLSNYSNVQRGILYNILGSFSESEREDFLNQRMRELSTVPTFAAFESEDSTMRIMAFNDILFARTANATLTNYINQRLDKDPEIKLVRDSIVLKEYDIKRRGEWLNKLKKAENNILRNTKDLEIFLSQNISTFDEVKSNLGAGDAYILFCPLTINKDLQNSISGYGAYIIKSSSTAPDLVFLCEIDSIENVFYNPMPDTEFISNLYSMDKGKEMYDMIWSKLNSYISECNNIFYSLSGSLYTINFDALVTPENKRLRDVYNLNLISDPRYIKQKERISKDNLSLVAFGAPAFNISSKEMANMATEYLNFSGLDISENIVALRGELLRGNWLDIPGTKKEVELIESIISLNGGVVKSYYDKYANEESFKELDGHSPMIIHVATHGFVISTDNQYENSIFAQSFGGISEKETYMLWTGLVFSGGNNTWNGEKVPHEIEDGILTAAEISRMDLSNTKLVVLSACETARGHIDSVEGVWGLQRAFKDAGVKSILMTLWKIPDTTTTMFMEQFYSQLTSGCTLRESLHKAQQYLIDNGASDPFYWAPFIILD